GAARPAPLHPPLPLAGAVGQHEAVRRAHPGVHVGEARHHPGDEVAHTVVVVGEGGPVEAGQRGERGPREAADDGDLRAQGRPGGGQAALAAVHHAHRVFDRDELRAARLHVELRPAQAGQDQRGLAGRE
ncbi:MAG: hypothetical protein ACK559_01545, partial [bacterium]